MGTSDTVILSGWGPFMYMKKWFKLPQSADLNTVRVFKNTNYVLGLQARIGR